MFKAAREQGAITVAETIKTVFKKTLKTNERQKPDRNLGFVNVFAVQFDIAVKPHHQRRHERAGNDVAGKNRKHHGFRQRHKQITRDAGQKKHRHKHDANAQRGDERRQHDFLRAFENRIFQRLSQGHVPVNIFDGDGGIIHQNSHRQCQTAQRHQIDGFTQRAQSGDGTKHGQRNGQRNDEGAAPRAEKQ